MCHSVSQPSSSVPSGLSPRSSPVTELCSLPSGRRTVRRIPKGSCEVALAKLSTILEEVVSQNSVASWQQLLEFPSRCFGAPTHGGRSRSLVSFVNRQIEDESGLQGCSPSSLRRSPRTTSDALCHLISLKLEEGDFRGAIRLHALRIRLPLLLKRLIPPWLLFTPNHIHIPPTRLPLQCLTIHQFL